MIESCRNAKRIDSGASIIPVYELEDISRERWNRQAVESWNRLTDDEKQRLAQYEPGKRRPTINSREVAQMVEKRHADLLHDIETYIRYMDSDNEREIASVDFFLKSSYSDAKGERRSCYDITKMGCEMIANKMTGAKGVLFTAAYVKKFNAMESGHEVVVGTSGMNVELQIKLTNSKVREANALYRLSKQKVSNSRTEH